MSDKPKDTPFFIGFLAVPEGLRMFLISMGVSMVVFFAVIATVWGLSQDDPGPGQGFGRHTVTGVLEVTPYPIVHVTEGTDRVPTGSTLMLSGGGKNGVIPRGAPLAGQMVVASGLLLNRGDLNMLQARGGANGLAAAEEADAIPLPAPEPLGRWRLAGEICDGKCYAGIMRPGTGLAHKACADLCIVGGIPPVFVSSQPVEGETFLMIIGLGGTEITRETRNWIARYITAEGEITRHGDLLIFELDPATVEPVQ